MARFIKLQIESSNKATGIVSHGTLTSDIAFDAILTNCMELTFQLP